MEFNAYKDGTTKKSVKFKINFGNLIHNINSKRLGIVLIAIILTGGLIVGSYSLITGKSISTLFHAGGCYEKIDKEHPVNVGCVGDGLMGKRYRVELCCPGKGCKFWKYEPAGSVPDARCNNRLTPTPTVTNEDTRDIRSKRCTDNCKKLGAISSAYNRNTNKCGCTLPNNQIVYVGTDCTKNSDCGNDALCIDHYCIPTKNQPVGPMSSPKGCEGKQDGSLCHIDKNDGLCVNQTCYNKNYIISTNSASDCEKYGATSAKEINGTVYCLNCQNKPISQAPIICQPPQCTGAKACVDPGTTSPGTDCIWYICDTKGSGLWVKTDSSCTQPAPTGTSNGKPTPTPLRTPTPTPTPSATQTAVFPEITATRTKTGQCEDSTGGYTAHYTINIAYPSSDTSNENTVKITVTENLDTQIDPAWVNSVNNSGQVNTADKTIVWNFSLNKGESAQLNYTIDYPSQALGNTYTNTAHIRYGTDSLGYKTKDLAEYTTASCANANDTSTPTPTAVPNTGIFDNIAITIGALSTVVIGLIIGL